MAKAFEPRDCYQSDVDAIGRLLTNCDIDQVPPIPFDPDARSVLMSAMPTATITTRAMRRAIASACVPIMEWSEEDQEYMPMVASQSIPYITNIVLSNDGNKLIGITHVSTFDTCGNFIRSVRDENIEIAELGGCPESE